mmetsp:Transcript_40912/g.95029  ORF Transcript_40912/g.95029 Transcript_40912/m.95029 type:complete len:738 (+) Transcript_40912:41-2254(+)
MAPSSGRASVLCSSSVDRFLHEILSNLEEDGSFVHLLAHHRRKFRVPFQEMEGFYKKFCHLCLSTILSTGQDSLTASLRKAEQELKTAREDFEVRLAKCHLGAMKQLDVVKGGSGEPSADDRVTFFEPLRHLEEDQKTLVLMIVKEKLQNILDGSASASFLEELRRSMGFDPAKLQSNRAKNGKHGQAGHQELLHGDEDEDDADDLELALRRAKAATRSALRQSEEDKKHIKSLLQELEVCRKQLFTLREQLPRRQLEAVQAAEIVHGLQSVQLEPEEARFVMSELSQSGTGISGKTGIGHEVVFQGAPEDCTSECVSRWHEESGLSLDSLIAVDFKRVTQNRGEEGEAGRPGSVSRIHCTYGKESDAKMAVRTLQDSVLTSQSGKQSRVRVSLASKESGSLQSQTMQDPVPTSPGGKQSRVSASMISNGSGSPLSSIAKPLTHLASDAGDDGTFPGPGGQTEEITVSSVPSPTGGKLPHPCHDSFTPSSPKRLAHIPSPTSRSIQQPERQVLRGATNSEDEDRARAALESEARKDQQIEQLVVENKKLKVCMEELQAKLRQLMGNCTERGFGDEVIEIVNKVGLRPVLACPSRFDLLYQDAFERIERLEELRRRIREERRQMGDERHVREESVLSVVERSPLVILQQLCSEGPVGFSLISPTGSPKRWKRPQRLSTPPSDCTQANSGKPSVMLPLILPKHSPSSASAPNLRALGVSSSSAAPNLQNHAMRGRRLLV